MPAQWTAELIGKMHLAGVTAKQLAAEAGLNPKYLSTILNGHYEPKNAEQTLREALDRLISKTADEKRQLKGGKRVKYPKLVIVSDGHNSALALDGVVIGRGVDRVEFVAGGDTPPKIRILEVNVATALFETNPDFLDSVMREMAKE